MQLGNTDEREEKYLTKERLGKFSSWVAATSNKGNLIANTDQFLIELK